MRIKAFINYALLMGACSCAGTKTLEPLPDQSEHEHLVVQKYKVLHSNSNAQTKIDSEMSLAHGLLDLKLNYSSSHYLKSVLVSNVPTTQIKNIAFNDLAKIDQSSPLGNADSSKLIEHAGDVSSLSEPGKSFYNYYRAREYFKNGKYLEAKEFFSRESKKSPFYVKSIFHLGIIATFEGESQNAIRHFHRVIELAHRMPNADWIKQQATLNIARVFYEKKDYVKSVSYYAQIPRNSDNWLLALFEASWAFFLMEKPNNTLGNIHTLHSPFFDNRFFPESYILEAVTYLRLCMLDHVKESVASFRSRYSPVLESIEKVLQASKEKPQTIFNLVEDYRAHRLHSYENAWPIFDALTRTDLSKQAFLVLDNVNAESIAIESKRDIWQSSGLYEALKTSLEEKRKVVIANASLGLYADAVKFRDDLIELRNQTKSIKAELLLGKIDSLRQKLNIKATAKKEHFISGMQPLVIGQKLEYWPFEGEYWEDELGGYVYNIASQCKK